MKLFICLVLSTYWAVHSVGACGQDQFAPKLSFSEYKTLIVEQTYAYSVEKYSPIFELLSVSKGKENYSSVEGALQAYFSSMQAGDFDWNNNCWTQESVQMMRDQDQKIGKKPESWVKDWLNFYPKRRIQLVSQIKFGKYVLVEYRTVPNAGAGPVTSDTLALVKHGQDWKVTQELAEDPILTNWRNGGRVQIPPSHFFQK